MSDSAGSSRTLTLVFTDLADSAALKTARGDRPAAELIERHRARLRALAAETYGRVIDWAGDGCFLTFETPSAAVAFALGLQQVHTEEPELPAVRVGVHMGEVSEEPGPDGDAAHPRVEGLAVDLAARIAGLARPGQILLSAPVADSARQRLSGLGFARPVAWRVHGPYTLKGVAEPLEIREVGLEGVAPFVAPAASEKAAPAARPPRLLRAALLAGVLAAVLAAGVFWTSSRRADSQPPERKSIAVLPFVNMSSDPENEYFSDGITEDLITALAKLSGLRVAARTSSFVFKGKNEPVEAMGAQLHVGAILEGSVARAGDRVRITAQLIDAQNGFYLWSESYDRKLEDVFAIRSEVAQTVAKSLEVTLEAGERQKLERKPTDDVEAYQLYLKGRYALATYKDFPQAMLYFQQAIERDPNYALAYMGMASYYASIADYALPPREVVPRAREAAERALALDPTLAETHTWLALVQWWYDRDAAAARRSFEAALALQPDHAYTLVNYGTFLLAVGEADAGIAACRRAAELDPLSAEISTWNGLCLYMARRHPEAIEQLRVAIALSPDYWYPHEWLASAYARTGRFPEALAELEIAERLDPNNAEIEGVLGRVQADAGNRAEALRILERLSERSRHEYVAITNLASVQIGLGEYDAALTSLARALDEREIPVSFWPVDPLVDPLRGDPRFAELQAKAGRRP
jgi:TolB-like protein/class 3 adenylate cyclase/Flp pilus assembly protein TadD